MNLLLILAVLLAGWLAALPAAAVTLPGLDRFIDRMVERHQFRRDELQRIFARTHYRYSVIDAISRPSTSRPWPEYRAVFVNPGRIREGVKFWHKYRRTLLRAEKRYGVPREIIVAIIGVETNYGRNAGNFHVIDALTTLAFKYPRRADFFRGELEQYLLLAREQHFNPLLWHGSYAGAIGIPQFMPSSYRKYAVDFNGNHSIDLLREPADAIGSVANYLKEYGWQSGVTAGRRNQWQDRKARARWPVAVPVKARGGAIADDSGSRTVAAWTALGVVPDAALAGNPSARLVHFNLGNRMESWLAFNNFEVITRYNNSDYYAMSVYQLAEELKAAYDAGGY